MAYTRSVVLLKTIHKLLTLLSRDDFRNCKLIFILKSSEAECVVKLKGETKFLQTLYCYGNEHVLVSYRWLFSTGGGSINLLKIHVPQTTGRRAGNQMHILADLYDKLRICECRGTVIRAFILITYECNLHFDFPYGPYITFFIATFIQT